MKTKRPGEEFLQVADFGPSRWELQKRLQVSRGWLVWWFVCAWCGWMTAGVLWLMR